MASAITVAVTPPTPPVFPSLGSSTVPMNFQVAVPGGAVLSLPGAAAPTNMCHLLINGMLPQITMVIAPFAFIFCIVDIILQIKKVLDSIPDAILSLDPGGIFTEIANLIIKLQCLLRAIPQLSVPLFLRDLKILMLAILDCMITMCNDIKTRLSMIDDALAQAGNNQVLKDMLNNAKAGQNAATAQVLSIANPLTPIFAALSMLMQLIGLSPISFTPPAEGSSIDDILAALQAARAVIDSIPF